MKLTGVALLLVFSFIISLFSVVGLSPAASAIEGPDIVFSLVNTDPDPVQAGENFDLRFKVENLGDRPFYNLEVTLDVEYPFRVVGERQKSIGTLGAQQQGNEGVIVRFLVGTDSNAQGGTYDFKVKYAIGKEGVATYEVSDSIVVDEREEPQYLLTPEEANADNNLVIGVTNAGKGNLSFVNVRLVATEDYRVTKSPLAYIGILESDEFDTAEFNIEPENPTALGESVTVQTVITFTDDYDNQITAEERVEVPLALLSGNNNASGGSFLSSFLTIAVAILFLVFAVFMLADNFRAKRVPFRKVLWTIVILTIIGTPIYYFVARNKE